MSRSNPTPTNPSTKQFRWSGSTGKLLWYDRDSKTMKPVESSFTFLVLDELSTIGGYSDLHKSGIWANEVRTTKDPLNVRTSAGQIAVGPYEQIKDALKATGGKYARSVYIAYQEGSDWIVGNMKLTGAALGAWFDLKRLHNVEVVGIKLVGSTTGKTGSVEYHIPIFEVFEPDAKTNDRADDLDCALQTYLTATLSARAEAPAAEPLAVEEIENAADSSDNNNIDLSEIPF